MWKILVVLVGLATLPAQASNTAPSDCVARLNQLVELIGALEQSASNDVGRVECIAEYRINIQSLAEIARTFSEARTAHLVETNAVAAENDQSLIQSACVRAEKLALAAADCQRTGNPATKNLLPPPISPTVALPVTNLNAPAPAIPIGDETTCLKQFKLAALLAQAMGLAAKESVETPIQMLTKQMIEPPAGWRAEACVTLGDFCVVVGRVLELKVVEPANPASYISAVRNDGLPLDALAARHPREVLHEAEVRAFLARGYAAPLPSSRRLQPD